MRINAVRYHPPPPDVTMLELYHHGSSACAAKVRFRRPNWSGSATIDIRGQQFCGSGEPKAVVPVLVHVWRRSRESTVICEYAEERFRKPDYRAPRSKRAQVRIWTKAVDEDLHPACSALTYVVSHRHTILRDGVAALRISSRAARPRMWPREP